MASARNLILCVTLGALGQAQDLETVEDFRTYYKTYEATPERVEAVRALEGVDHAEVVDALLEVLPKAESRVFEVAVEVLGGFEARPPVERMLAVLAKEKKEVLRLGLLRAMAVGGYAPLGEPVVECLEDRSWAVRCQAVAALVATGNLEHVPALVGMSEDKEVAVR